MSAMRDVYDFVDSLNRDPALLARFEQDPKAVLDASLLSPEEQAALLDGSPPVLAGLGMHPLVLMRYSLARNPAIKEHISLREYLDEMGEQTK
jgi:hypothetical protein